LGRKEGRKLTTEVLEGYVSAGAKVDF